MYGKKSIVGLLNDSQLKEFQELPEKLQEKIDFDLFGDQVRMFKVLFRDITNYNAIYVHVETDKKLYTVAYTEKHETVQVICDELKSNLYLFLRYSEAFLNEVKNEIEEVESYKCKK